MKTCKVKPSISACRMCMDTPFTSSGIPDCKSCHEFDPICELLSVGTSFWNGDYAMILRDGKIEKVSSDQIYDVKEEENYGRA